MLCLQERLQGKAKVLQPSEPYVSGGDGNSKRQDLHGFGKARTDWGQLAWVCVWEIISHKLDLHFLKR